MDPPVYPVADGPACDVEVVGHALDAEIGVPEGLSHTVREIELGDASRGFDSCSHT